MKDSFGSFARVVNTFASSPGATAGAFALVVVWAASGPYLHYSDFWQLIMNTISGVITFIMVFVLNNAQSRDTAAINAKLDSIVFAVQDADNRLIGLESQKESLALAVIEDVRADVDDAKAAFKGATNE